MGDIVWLSSLPKVVGNTWLRIFLANLMDPEGKAVDINKLTITRHAGSRRDFDEILGVESSDMTRIEIAQLRTTVLPASSLPEVLGVARFI